MRLSLARLSRGCPRRSLDGAVSGHVPAPELQSSLGKYTKDYANLPERYVIRKSASLLYKSEKGEPWASPPSIELTHLMHHARERPWNADYRMKYRYDPDEEYGYVVDPIREHDWMWFRGDRVQVLTGKDKGKQGYINYIVQERNWVTVEGLNVEYEFMGEDKKKNFPGMMVIKERPLDVTKDIKLVDPSDEKAADVEWRYKEDGTRIRVSTRTGVEIPIPSEAASTVDYKSKAGYKDNKDKDTKADDVEEITFEPKLATFDMDIMEKMGINETRKPARTYWY